jgi:hypothetical protein
MKQCKSCCKEIEEKAKVCPYCRTHQKWYENTRLYASLSILFILGIMYWQMGLIFTEKFLGNENHFKVEELSSAEEKNMFVVNYKITNETSKTWKNIEYEVTYYDDNDKIVYVKSDSNYSWTVHPQDSSLLSVETYNSYGAKKWKMRIVDLKSGRF